jgi:hypothetical protein
MVAHFPSASVNALGDLLDTSADCASSGGHGRLPILPVVTDRAVTS